MESETMIENTKKLYEFRRLLQGYREAIEAEAQVRTAADRLADETAAAKERVDDFVRRFLHGVL